MQCEPVSNGELSSLPHAENGGDCRHDEVRVTDRRQISKRHPVGEAADQRVGHRESETGLADTAGSGQREEARVAVAEMCHDRGNLALSADE